MVRILPFRDSHYDASTTSKNHIRSGESRRFRLAGHRPEFMDFQLYSLGAALVFHEIFFPEQSAAMALILAMGTYGAGYIARIVGAFIFGRMGDSIGRKKVLFITITMMGICTTLIGVLPTYAQIGILPRAAGDAAHYSGPRCRGRDLRAGTMLAEYAPKGKRGIISSLVAMGTNCGTLSATAIWAIMFFALDREQLLAWGWRVPFLASVVVMIFAIWLRMNLKESPVFEKVNDVQAAQPDTSLGSMVKSKSFWLATGLRFGRGQLGAHPDLPRGLSGPDAAVR